MPADLADPSVPAVAGPMEPRSRASEPVVRAGQREARAEQLQWFLVSNDGASARPPPTLALALLLMGLCALRLVTGASSFVELLEWLCAAAGFVLGVALARLGSRSIRWRRVHGAAARALAKAFTGRVLRGIDQGSNRWFDAHWIGEGGPALNEERLAVETVVHSCAVLVEITPAARGARVVTHVGGLVPPSAVQAIDALRPWVDSSGYEVILVDGRLRIVRSYDARKDADRRWLVEDAERLVVVLREVTRAMANAPALAAPP
jgi:hypothetical protein